jgi:hypothetical protein
VRKAAALLVAVAALSAPRAAMPGTLDEWSRDAAQILAPRVLEAVEAVAATLPAPAPAPASAALLHPEAVALIVRWEVGSQARYTAKYQGVIWPGGASGPTWGIGYDGGHQTKRTIAADWWDHRQVEFLVETSGVTGQRAKAELNRWRGVLTPYQYAVLVFETRALIQYERLARRAFPGFDRLRPRARGALVSLVYNRGAGMTGDARREMRALRDRCVPAADYGCMAVEIRKMCRLWVNTPNGKGLCARRDDEARLTEKQ